MIADAPCTACSCVCDDIILSVAGEQIVAAEHACARGEQWFLRPRAADLPACRIRGQAASLDEGIERTARLLTEARYPLVYGLSQMACEAQRVAVAIADWIGGNLDTPTSVTHGPTGVAFQGVGEVTCSLGEIANRGDLVIFWGANPAESHPRHLSRYSLFPHGMFVPRGRADRTCIVVDPRNTETAREADVHLRIAPGADFEALWILRALAAGIEPDAARVVQETGIELAVWQDLMARMKAARFGVILFGRGLTTTRGQHLNCEAVLALVRDMNAYTRFVAKSLREPGNATGADSVVTWTTGYPFGVNLSRGYPRFNPGEFTANEMLARGEVDAAFLITAEPNSDFSPAARAHLATIPTVALEHEPTAANETTEVAFLTATPGIHTAGTVYRMDDVPLPLRPALASTYPSDLEVLSRVETRVRELARAPGARG